MHPALTRFFRSPTGAWLLAKLAGLSLLAGLLVALAGCARAPWHVPMAARADVPDSALVLAGLPPGSKFKIGGNLILQTGGHNTASPADNRKAGQRQGSAATAPGATATTTATNAAAPLWVWGLVAALGAAAGCWLRGRLPGLGLP